MSRPNIRDETIAMSRCMIVLESQVARTHGHTRKQRTTVTFPLALKACFVFFATSTCVIAADIYVQAGADADGSGARMRPFNSLLEAQDRSHPGDTLFLLPGRDGRALKGGIALKRGQALIGLGPNGRRLARGAPALVRVTHSAGTSPRALVEAAIDTVIRGIHFEVTSFPAIAASATPQPDPFSGLVIHENLFTGEANEQADVVYAIDLDALSGSVHGVRVNENVFRDGGSLGGVRVAQRGSSTGVYRFEGNRFENLGARAYYVLTTEDSEATSQILDSTAANIGRGNRNSDSILPYLMGRSRQAMLVERYRYSNAAQVGNASNTGLELWIFGGRGDRSTWCTACKVKLNIVDSVFDGAVTDGIQLTNFGSNTVMDIAIRNTKVRRANPRQAGGAISLIAENAQNSGSRATLLIENSDLSGSSQYAFVVVDESPGSSAVVDLGGGALGSRGGNRLSGAGKGGVMTQEVSVSARNNWWGTVEPKAIANGNGVVVEVEPILAIDPGG